MRLARYITISALCLSACTSTEKTGGPFCDCVPDNKGPLIVKAGSVVTLAAGKTYLYENIIVHKGGVLEIVGEGEPEWTIIKTSNDFRVEGTIRSRGFAAAKENLFSLGADKLKSSSYNLFGMRLRDETDGPFDDYKYGDEASGGEGGTGGRSSDCAPRSSFKLSCMVGGKGQTGKGGQGGTGMSKGEFDLCGSGSDCHSCYLLISRADSSKMARDIGNDVGRCHPCHDLALYKGALAPGGGGGGGGEGSWGGLLYIASCGNFYGERGTIDVSGGTGGKGDDGTSNKFSGGGGGGGGPGGRGGAIYMNVSGYLSLPTIKVGGGPGGRGGAGGVPHPKDGLASLKGSDGKKGSSGPDGKFFIFQ